MFTTKKIENPSLLEESITSAFNQLEAHDAGTEEYAAILDKIERLEALRPKKKELSVSGDAIIGAATNVLGLVLVLNYEKIGVISSKAFGLIVKSKM